MQGRWATAAATAIVAVAAVALVLVERGGREAESPPSAPTLPEPVARPVEVEAVAPPPAERAPPPSPQAGRLIVLRGPPPIAPEVRAGVQEQATSGAARLREVVLATCRPAVDAMDGPTVFTLHLSFDAEGKEVARSASADPPAPSALETCVLLAAAGTLRVDAGGAPVSARVALELP